MRSIVTTCLCLALTAALASDSLAQPPGGRGGPGPQRGFNGFLAIPILQALDANSDREISAAEIEGAAAALKKLDRNEDGKLTMDELRPQGGPGRGFGGFGPGRGQPPRDGERRIRGDRDRGGDDADDDDDDDDDDRDRRRGDERRRDDDDARGGRPDFAQGFVARLMSYDKDEDGKISKEEAPERMARLFDRLDRNDDGSLDADELRAVAGRFGGAGPEGRGEGDRERGPRDGEQRRGAGPPDRGPEARRDFGPGRGFGGPPSPEQFVQMALNFDQDGDGKLDAKELGKLAEEIGRRRGGPGRGPAPDEGRGRRPARPDRE